MHNPEERKDTLFEGKLDSKKDGGYGWVIVAMCFLSTAFGDGMLYTYGTFYSELMDLYDESISKIMIGGFLMLGSSNAVGPLGAALVNKFGFRKVMAFGAISSTIAISCSSIINSILWFNMVIGIIAGSTQGLTLLGAYTITPLWFEKRRSIACSIAYCGVGFGCMVYPVIIELLISIYSIRGCLLIMGAINLNLLVFAVLIREPSSVTKMKPIEIKMKNSYDNISDSKPHHKNDFELRKKGNKMRKLIQNVFQPELFRNIPFWIIISSTFLLTIILFAIPQTIKNYVDVMGFSKMQSAVFSITFGAMGIVARLAIGVTERYIKKSKLVYVVSGVLLAIATGLVGVITSYYYLIFYAVVLGATGSNTIIMRYIITAEYIQRKHLTSAYGWTFLLQSTTLFVALFIAKIGTEYGDYPLSFAVNGIIAFLGSLVMLLLFLTKPNV